MTPALLLIKAAVEPQAQRNGNAARVLHSIAERLHSKVEKRVIDGVEVVARPHSIHRSGLFSEVFNVDAGAARFFVSVREDEVSVNLYDIRAGEVAEVYDGTMNPAAVLKWAMHAAAAYSIKAAYAASEAPAPFKDTHLLLQSIDKWLRRIPNKKFSIPGIDAYAWPTSEGSPQTVVFSSFRVHAGNCDRYYVVAPSHTTLALFDSGGGAGKTLISSYTGPFRASSVLSWALAAADRSQKNRARKVEREMSFYSKKSDGDR